MPAPRATNGTPLAVAGATTACTSSVEPGSTTSAGIARQPGEPVAVVDAELLGLVDHVLVAERRAQLGDDRRRRSA